MAISACWRWITSGQLSLQRSQAAAVGCQLVPMYASPRITPHPRTDALVMSSVRGWTRSNPAPNVNATESPIKTPRTTPGTGCVGRGAVSAGAVPALAFATSGASPVAGMLAVTATNVAATPTAVAGAKARTRQPRSAPRRIGSSTR